MLFDLLDSPKLVIPAITALFAAVVAVWLFFRVLPAKSGDQAAQYSEQTGAATAAHPMEAHYVLTWNGREYEIVGYKAPSDTQLVGHSKGIAMLKDGRNVEFDEPYVVTSLARPRL